jgi:hypothetical protein
MKTRKNTAISAMKKAKARVADSAPTAKGTGTTEEDTANAALFPMESSQPVFKEWRIETFADISDVDPWFMDKVIYIMNHLLRKGRIMKRRLIEFTFPEKGIVTILWQDIETGILIHEPTQDVDIDAPQEQLDILEDPLA